MLTYYHMGVVGHFLHTTNIFYTFFTDRLLRTCMRVCVYVRYAGYVCVYVRLYNCAYVYMEDMQDTYVCMYVCMCICAYMNACILHVCDMKEM